jgi:hypothetical protein
MELFIQIRDGKPYEHPISGDNLRQAFPEIDTENLPDSFAPFVRVPVPPIGIWETLERSTYEWANGVVQDAHHVRPLTELEIAEKKRLIEEDFLGEINVLVADGEVQLAAALPENKHYWQEYIDALRAVPVPYGTIFTLPLKPLFTETGEYVPRTTLEITRV